MEQHNIEGELVRLYTTEYEDELKLTHTVELPKENYTQTTEWEYDASNKWKIEAVTDNMGRLIRQLHVDRDEHNSITYLKQIEPGQGSSGVAERRYENEYF